MAEPHTFADRLHALCQDEMVRVGRCPDGGAAIVTELYAALTDAVALLSRGQIEPSSKLASDLVATIPHTISMKADAVRQELEDREHLAGEAHVR